QVLDIIIGKGPSAKNIRLPLNRFTLIGATTKIGMLSSPLRDRFGSIYRLRYYEEAEIEKIIQRSAQILKVQKMEKSALQKIACCSRRTPRVANRLLKRVRDYAQVKTGGIVNLEVAHAALTMLEIDGLGLDHIDRELLKTIIEKFDGGPVGLRALSASSSEEQDAIEEVYEPFLLQIGLIARTPRGRIATAAAYQHLNIAPRRQKLI
ncbi:MAG: Holliday junction branch migration DNA helicase RuvB, partial [bacterium]|nr:Holliday junction branch migration DNA helicase RuvB [bacterium]